MNVRLRYEIDMLAGVYYAKHIHINSYSIRMDLITQTRDPVSTNIAMDRCKVFINEVLAHTIFVHQDETAAIAKMDEIGTNVTTLPEEPIDQIIGMMLYYKLNAIMEGRMLITNLEISSILGDSVWYPHDAEDQAGPFAPAGWWQQSTTVHRSSELGDRVVKVGNGTWSDMHLGWPESQSEKSNNAVIYTFPKNEN